MNPIFSLSSNLPAWNTVYLARAIETLRASGEEVADELVAHILPLGWEHVILLGRYEFNPAEARPLSQLRPLRTVATTVVEEENEDAPTRRRQ